MSWFGSTSPGGGNPAPTAPAVGLVLLAAISAAGAIAVRSAISAAPDVTTTYGDLPVHGDGGLGRLAVSGAADGSVLTVTNRTVAWAAPASSSPVDSLPEPASVALWLRNADLRGSDGTFASQWPAVVGPDLFGYANSVTGSTDAIWYGGAVTGFPIFQTTSGVREIRWQGNYGGCAPILPAAGAGVWSVALVVVGAQLTGTSASLAGWGHFAAAANVTFFSRLNSLTAWGITVRGSSQTDVTQAILNGGAYPATTDPTALLGTYDGATLSLWKAVAADSAWVSIGTLSVTLAISTTTPFCLARAGGNTAYSSTVGIREAIVWRTALDSTARTALRAYITTAGVL